METLGEVAKEIEEAAVGALKQEGRLSWQEALTQVGVRKPEAEGSQLETSLAESTETVNGTLGTFHLREQVNAETEHQAARLRAELASFREVRKQEESLVIAQEFRAVQDSVQAVEDQFGIKTNMVRSDETKITISDVALERQILISRKAEAQRKRNPIRSAVRVVAEFLSVLWTPGAKRDAMTETAAMTQAAG